MNDVSVIHFSKVLEVLGGSLLPEKNINNSSADAGRKIAEEHTVPGPVESKKKKTASVLLLTVFLVV